MDYEHGACAPEVGTEIEARDGEPGVYVQARSRSSLGWACSAYEQEEAMDGGLQALSRSSLGWAPVGEPQDDEVSHARGVAVAMDVQVKASEDEDEDDDEDEDAMLREVVRRHAYGSWRR